ncbi:MAG: hypothetical protein K2M17_01610 [Bacilli bacterium]|nr:hypothetical protein [Bacilli bacterium]
MKLYVTIDFFEEQTFSSMIDTNALYLVFNSFESCYKFLQHPLSITFDEDNFKFLDKKEWRKVKKARRYFNLHLSDLLKSTIIQVNHIQPCHLNNINLLQNTCLVDLTHLPIDTLWEVLNANWPANTLFKDRFNEIEFVTQQRLLNAYQSIMNIVHPLRAFSPSPAEICYLAYDICRQRIAKKNTTKMKKSRSRDLCQVLENDEIVCVGYVNLFMCICYFFGVTTDFVIWKNKVEGKDGHATCIAYVNDDKYGIHGLFAFNPTTNRKKSDADVDYINNCSGAFLPLEEHNQQLEENMSLCSDGLSEYPSLYKQLKNWFRRYQVNMENAIPPFLLQNSKSLVINSLNNIYSLLGLEAVDFSISYEDLTDRIQSLEATSNAIDVETFDELVRNVRAIEHSLDATFPIDENSIALTVASSSSVRNKRAADFRKILQMLFATE